MGLRRLATHCSLLIAQRWAGGVALVVCVLLAQPSWGQFSLRFYGHGVSDIDRVKVKIDAPATPADVANDFTLEWWMKATLADNNTPPCPGGGDAWINGNIMFDRDVFGSGDFGDFGVSLYGGQIAFGVDRLGTGNTVCSENDVADGTWHHIAVTRNATTGVLRIFVDGQLQGEDVGPSGNVSYNDGRPTAYPNSDPYLVIGAEKHDAGSAYPSYNGLIDEIRLSDSIIYAADFTPPTGPTSPEASTVALYHFDEGPVGACSGTVLETSEAAGGPSNGVCNFGGSSPGGPVYVGDTPFGGPPPQLCAATPIASGCRTASKGLLVVKDDGDSTGDRLLWKWLLGQATDAGALGNPLASTSYGLCVYDALASVPALKVSATVAATLGWKSTASGFKYAASNGISKIVLKTGSDGEAKVLVKGKGTGLNLPAAASPSAFFNQDNLLKVQLVNSDGECWEADYTTPAIKHQVDLFKDKRP